MLSVSVGKQDFISNDKSCLMLFHCLVVKIYSPSEMLAKVQQTGLTGAETENFYDVMNYAVATCGQVSESVGELLS